MTKFVHLDQCSFDLCLTLRLLVSSADNFCKQFRSRSGLTKCQAWSGSKLFDTLIKYLKEFFQKIDFEKNQQTTKKHAKLPSRQSVKVPTMTALWYHSWLSVKLGLTFHLNHLPADNSQELSSWFHFFNMRKIENYSLLQRKNFSWQFNR